MTTVNYAITNTDDDVADYIPSSGLGVVSTEVVNGATYQGGGVYSEAVRAGFRFLGVVPAGTDVIDSATLTLTRRFSPDGTHQGWIHAVLIGNAPPWSTTSPRSAVRSVARVLIVDGAVQNYDVTALLQEIMPLRSPGDALAFVGSADDADGSASWQDYSSSAANAAQLSITYSAGGPPTLSLSLDKTTVHANAPVGYVVANILGKSSGSALSDGISDAKLTRVDTEVRVASALTQGSALNFEVVETLAGSPNSPYTFSSTINVGPPRIAEFVEAASGTTTPVLPAHQAGDMLVCFMFRDGSTTTPALPSGWEPWATATGSTCSYRLCYKIATSSSESGGTPTTATSCITSVYRPAEGFTLSAGVVATGSTGTSSTVTYPALTLDANGFSIVGGAGGHRAVNTNIQTPPAGMVLRANALDATDEAAMFDTDGPVSSWTAKSVSIAGSASGRLTTVFEIKGTATGGISYRRRSTWISLID